MRFRACQLAHRAGGALMLSRMSFPAAAGPSLRAGTCDIKPRSRRHGGLYHWNVADLEIVQEDFLVRSFCDAHDMLTLKTESLSVGRRCLRQFGEDTFSDRLSLQSIQPQRTDIQVVP